MISIFGITIVLYFIKIFSGSRNYILPCLIDVNELISCNSDHVHKLYTQLNTKTKKSNYAFLKQREMENTGFFLSPPQRLLFFKKPRKRGKGGKKGKMEKRERRNKRERKGKAKKASARFLSKYGKSGRYPTAHSPSAG